MLDTITVREVIVLPAIFTNMDFKHLNCKVFFIVVVVIVSIFFCYLFVSSKHSDCYVEWLELRHSPTEIHSEGWSGRNMNC